MRLSTFIIIRLPRLLDIIMRLLDALIAAN
jgi:hypothetical protein